ncbi:MAG TPA: hypothetical protein VL418_05195 [Devosiaceae bacterium]|nr:hypothetical protein [Devosiaceae bacterium]
MASILPIFRTRSPARDQAGDTARRGSVRESINAALTEAQREMSGLERRISEGMLATVTLMDQSGSYQERSREDEAAIVEHERETERANRRLVTLRGEIDRFTQMLRMIDEAV